jgi:hypothetical protein
VVVDEPVVEPLVLDAAEPMRAFVNMNPSPALDAPLPLAVRPDVPVPVSVGVPDCRQPVTVTVF